MASEGGGGPSTGSDFLFFLGILILIFIAWVYTGGPSRPISFSSPFLSPPTSGVGTSTKSNTGGFPGNTASSNGPVSISASNVSGSDPRGEYVTISYSGSGNLFTSGWVLQNSLGRRAVFPLGVELPASGVVNQLAPIVLKPGDSVIVTTGTSPVGLSFRENTCTGYLGQYQHFTPALAGTCPLPSESTAANGLDENCRNYLAGLPYCSIPSSFPPGTSGSCTQYIGTHVNYNGCVADYRDTASFKKNNWRVFLNLPGELWGNTHDSVKLLDAKGTVIASTSY